MQEHSTKPPERDSAAGLDHKILNVLKEQLAARDAKANISQLKDQIQFVKKVMGFKQGKTGHADLKNEVMRIQQSLMMKTPEQ